MTPRVDPRAVWCALVLSSVLWAGCQDPPEVADDDGGSVRLDAAVDPPPALDAAVPDAARPSDAAAPGEDGGLVVAEDAGPPPACPTGDLPTITAVEGDRSHGAALTIRGCRFGDKAQAAPRLWDSVDNQAAYAGLSAGDEIPVDGSAPWTRNNQTWATATVLGTESPRGHRDAFYRISGGVHGGDGGLGWPRALGGTRPPPEQLMLYVSWWYRPSMDPGGGDPVGSNKFIRIWDHDGAERTSVSWTQMHIDYTGAEYIGWRSWTRDGNIGEWNRMEITVDLNRGTIRHYVNGVYQQVSNSAIGTFDLDDFEKNPSFPDLGLNVAILGFDHGLTSYGDMVTDFGEVYVDTTRARVEIGDAPTWEATRHREIQLPTAWSTDAVSIRVDEGTFEGLSGRYLYVVDADGRVNANGFAL